MKFPFLSLILLLAATGAVRGQSARLACESLGQSPQLKELLIRATSALAETKATPGPVARPLGTLNGGYSSRLSIADKAPNPPPALESEYLLQGELS